MNTLYVEVEPNEELVNLQKKILESIKPDQPFLPYPSSVNKKMKKNLRIYNYPFAYPDWIPHYTIASINETIEEKILISNNKMLEMNNKITKVSLWEISGNMHHKIKEFELGLR